MTHVTCHMSLVRCHMSGVRCQVSGVICKVSSVKKIWRGKSSRASRGGSVINGVWKMLKLAVKGGRGCQANADIG